MVVRWISFKTKILKITNIVARKTERAHDNYIQPKKKNISLSFLLTIFRVDSAIKKKIQINKIADCMKYVTP